MDFKRLQEAKGWYNKIIEFCDSFAKKGWIETKGLKFSEIYEYDILHYIMYLIAADSNICQQEVDVYRFITGYGGDDIDSIKEMIENSNVMTYNFQSEAPLSLKLLIKGLNEYLIENPDAEELVSNTIEIYLLAYMTIGKEVIRADDRVLYAEKRDCQAFCETLKQYIQENAYVSLEGTLASLLSELGDLF